MPYRDPEEERAYRRARYAANPEKARKRNRENQRKRRANDPDGSIRAHERDALRAWQQANPERVAENNRRWREANPEKFKEGQARKHRRGRHGLDPVKFAQLLAAQDGRCCFCQRPLQGRIDVDHDHSCTCGPDRSCDACRRGLACHTCNAAIGLLGDDPDRMELAAANLRRLTAEARLRINGKPVQAELFEIEKAARRREESA
jgi:Recombination endonuclease VII